MLNQNGSMAHPAVVVGVRAIQVEEDQRCRLVLIEGYHTWPKGGVEEIYEPCH